MDMQSKLARFAAIAGSAMMCSVMPVIPTASAKPPNCEVKAYLYCKDGVWEEIGYSDIDECVQWETEFCELGEGPPGGGNRCVQVPPLGIPFWYVCD